MPYFFFRSLFYAPKIKRVGNMSADAQDVLKQEVRATPKNYSRTCTNTPLEHTPLEHTPKPLPTGYNGIPFIVGQGDCLWF